MCFDIEQKALVPVLVVNAFFQVQECRDARPADVGDDYVQPAHRLYRVLNEALHGGFVGDIGLDGVEAGSGGLLVCGWNLGELMQEGFSASGVVGVVDYLPSGNWNISDC
jgi:hypothetical protein